MLREGFLAALATVSLLGLRIGGGSGCACDQHCGNGRWGEGHAKEVHICRQPPMTVEVSSEFPENRTPATFVSVALSVPER